jgi:hypothetical protein
MIRPLLLLEVNEIPWRVIDRFHGQPEYPALTRFFSTARNLTNVAVDSGELSPWITWPTFHRGMPKEAHGILHLGQDPTTFGGNRSGRNTVSVITQLVFLAPCKAGRQPIPDV